MRKGRRNPALDDMGWRARLRARRADRRAAAPKSPNRASRLHRWVPKPRSSRGTGVSERSGWGLCQEQMADVVRAEDPAREGKQTRVEGNSNAGRHERVVEGKGKWTRKCCLVAI